MVGAPADWKSVKQMVVAVSTPEPRYVTLSKACLIMLHHRHLLTEKHTLISNRLLVPFGERTLLPFFKITHHAKRVYWNSYV